MNDFLFFVRLADEKDSLRSEWEAAKNLLIESLASACREVGE